MKNRLLLITAFLTIALGLVSCQKSLQDQLVGTYHFKMSGSFDCEIYEIVNDTICSVCDTARFVASALTGQMRIVKQDEENLIVNMSVMLGGEMLSFQANLQNDTLCLKEHLVNMKLAFEGSQTSTSFTSTGKVIPLGIKGKGQLFSDTIVMTMQASGNFYYSEDKYKYVCRVLSQTSDIVCQAYKTN